MKNKRKK